MSHARRLTREDAPGLQSIRHESLCTEPRAFGATPEDCPFREIAAVEAHLANPDRAVYGIADPDRPERLVAMAGIIQETQKKQRHRATIWGVYVSPGSRGRGLGRAVVEACLDQAREWTGVDSVSLTVAAERNAAKSLYESLGFVTWGTDVDALRVDGMAVSLHYMLLKLSEGRR